MRLPLFGALDAAVGRFSITMGTLGQVVGMVVAGARAIEREIRLQSMHQKVQLSHQYVLEMIESLPSGIIVINPTGSIININRKA